jgi:CDP-paratose 2-epimerase
MTASPRVSSPPGQTRRTPPLLRDRLGVCQWFHYEDYAGLEQAVRRLRELGIRHLRTGISWADYFRPNGPAWYDAMMSALAEFDVLLSVWHTPPSISEGGTCASPPRRLRDYADFIDRLITDYGSAFTHLELWNEPNNRLKWDFEHFDPEWRKFGEMIGTAAYWAKQRGVPTVLGGMIPVDPHWLELMKRAGAMPYLDAIGIHAFPGMWWEGAPNWDWHRDWRGWEAKVQGIAAHAEGRPIWVTETGVATVNWTNGREEKLELQVTLLQEAALQCPAARIYWYSLIDLDPARASIEGFHVEENEYHLGLVRFDGRPKRAFHVMKDLLTRPDPLAAAEPAELPVTES